MSAPITPARSTPAPTTAAPGDAAPSWDEAKRRLVPAMLIGSTLEWYDMFLYAQAAALVFGTLFFSGASPLVGTVAAFATFGVGYAVRPLGALLFGHIGDRYGRRIVLVSTLVIMGAATTLIGLLPTYATSASRRRCCSSRCGCARAWPRARSSQDRS